MTGVVTLRVLFVSYELYIIYSWGDAMLVNRVRFGSSMDKKLDKKLRKLAEKSRITISKLLDEAIEDLLIKHSAEK